MPPKVAKVSKRIQKQKLSAAQGEYTVDADDENSAQQSTTGATRQITAKQEESKVEDIQEEVPNELVEKISVSTGSRKSNKVEIDKMAAKDLYLKAQQDPKNSQVPGIGIKKSSQSTLKSFLNDCLLHIWSSWKIREITIFERDNTEQAFLQVYNKNIVPYLDDVANSPKINPNQLGFRVFIDKELRYVTTIGFGVGTKNTEVTIGVKGWSGAILRLDTSQFSFTVDGIRASILQAASGDNEKFDFLESKPYIGYPINYTKRFYKIFRATYNKSLAAGDYSTAGVQSQIGGYKILVNVFKKFAQMVDAYKVKDNTADNTADYYMGADPGATGKGVRIRKHIKAVTRKQAPVEVMSAEGLKRLEKAYNRKFAQNKAVYTLGKADKILG